MENQETPRIADLPAAGFWVRGGAVAVDFAIMSIVTTALIHALSALRTWSVLQYAGEVTATYYIWMVGARGQTIGKMAAGVKVVRMDGGPVGYPRAMVRHFAGMLPVGYIIAAFTDKKRALHDYIADTRVIYPQPVSNGRKVLMAWLAVFLLSSPAVFAWLTIKNPAFSSAFKRPGEQQSAYDKFQTFEIKAKEAETTRGLASLKVSLAIYYGDAEGIYPQDPKGLISSGIGASNQGMHYPYLSAVPSVTIKDHPPTNEIEIYGNEVCIPGQGQESTTINGTKLRDTGKWGYVADKNSPCWGDIFVDCTHNNTRGVPWYSLGTRSTSSPASLTILPASPVAGTPEYLAAVPCGYAVAIEMLKIREQCSAGILPKGVSKETCLAAMVLYFKKCSVEKDGRWGCPAGTVPKGPRSDSSKPYECVRTPGT